jgi:hypothetical protein
MFMVARVYHIAARPSPMNFSPLSKIVLVLVLVLGCCRSAVTPSFPSPVVRSCMIPLTSFIYGGTLPPGNAWGGPCE